MKIYTGIRCEPVYRPALGQRVYTGTCLHANDTDDSWVTHRCKHNF